MTTPALEARVVAGFRERFGREPEVLAFAPGRVNLIGEHTDYNEGFVLPCALEQGTLVAVAIRHDRRVRVSALDLAGSSIDAIDEISALDAPILPLAPGHWANHPRGLLAAWQAEGHAIPGMDIAVGGDLPRGAGLSSSASLGVARLAQRSENETVGCSCGIMDPLVSAAARKGAALQIDCRSLTWQTVPIPEQVAVLVVHSGVSRELAGGDYNARRAECGQAAVFFGVASLRDLGDHAIAEAPEGLDATAYRRARHVSSENARVHRFAAALQAGDLVAAGAALRESHVSLRDDFEVSHPAVDALVDALDAAIGVEGGARMTGGGFGGCVVAVLPIQRLAAVRAAASVHLRAAGVTQPLMMDVRPAGGASVRGFP
jgi:galactokinase